MIRILLADDNSFITGGLEIILNMEENLEVVGTAENGEEAFQFCLEHAVDVALVDIRMPVLDGVLATKKITQETDTKVIILTTFDDDAFILEAIQNGAKGYLLKNNDPKKIVNAIHSVMQEQSIIQAEIWDKLRAVNQAKVGLYADLDALELTEREKDIVKAVAKGLSNREIAKLLFISEGTVANNISALLGKLGLSHRTQIAILYFTGSGNGDAE
ncbi:LuxR family two component transcriptional regulator [Listeria fleischmannii 1991]|uniref:LuxR family two component transcriptional regulator n=1 Tax=Listeria fleischmannii 1991 TaxID=1430899 RepID=A0A0J8GCN2_9LIST|nr:response regulator transcription factor [Listeria fleischmannii]EMG29286.1 LuxR family two component transcriptional regulator [Listeria fleischmannii subsp. fleischmannii LU2006-1]KMT58749.1 LuxR family two component transcriptional regulator [Listeria fleischmannii 1991]